MEDWPKCYYDIKIECNNPVMYWLTRKGRGGTIPTPLCEDHYKIVTKSLGDEVDEVKSERERQIESEVWDEFDKEVKPKCNDPYWKCCKRGTEDDEDWCTHYNDDCSTHRWNLDQIMKGMLEGRIWKEAFKFLNDYITDEGAETRKGLIDVIRKHFPTIKNPDELIDAWVYESKELPNFILSWEGI